MSPKQPVVYLLIVESSSKCAKIESYLGPLFKCIASNGHIRCIDGLKSIDVKHGYATTYSIDPTKADHVKKMRPIIAGFRPENVFLATDHDREGEAIAWHICDVFGLPVATTKRIVFHEITKPAIQTAVANPMRIDMSLVHAQQARQVLDMLVGFKVSPLLWKYISMSDAASLSAGRCQTPALRLVYDNERDGAAKAKGIKHMVKAEFFPENVVFELNREFDTIESVSTFIEASVKHNHMLEIEPGKLKQVMPPKPFNTASLLQQASNLYGMSAKDIMACCQHLYQQGHITYMRTDSKTYSPVFVAAAVAFIQELWTPEHIMSDLSSITAADDSIAPVAHGETANQGAAHEAIRVTNLYMREIVSVDTASDRANKIYKMIWLNSVQSCMSPAQYNRIVMKITAPESNHYSHAFEIPKFGGFQDTANKTSNSETIRLEQQVASITMCYKNKQVNYNSIYSDVRLTGTHSHYTEAGLIDALEKRGIGRPSTFAMLVDVIQTRNYVERKDVPGRTVECKTLKLVSGAASPATVTESRTMGAERSKLVIEPVGVTVIEFLLDKFADLFSYDYTEKMEAALDDVAVGKTVWYDVCAACNRELDRLCAPLIALEKKFYPLVEEEYVAFFHKNKLLIKHRTEKTAEGKPVYKSVKKDIQLDMAKMERGEYSINELVDPEKTQNESFHLGVDREGREVTLKTGRFGPYLEIGDEKKSLSAEFVKSKPLNMICMTDIENLLYETDSNISANSVLRKLTSQMSIRNGKFGPYVFYKTETMKKPKFLDLKGLTNFLTRPVEEVVQWVCDTHKIKLNTGLNPKK